jgi:hypothetical protein
VGKYLDIIDRAERTGRLTESAGPTTKTTLTTKGTQQDPFGRLSRLCRSSQHFQDAFAALERRRPDHIEPDRWQEVVEDGRRFLAQWGEQAAALGWSSTDLFGLHKPPTNPHSSYSRLSRYGCTGLCWLLRGCEVVALTECTATIRHPGGNITTYRRFNKPPLGPLGDSLDNFLD